MPIDSAAKRRNISALHAAFTIVGVTPDLLKPVDWRQAVGWGYLGVSPSDPNLGGSTGVIATVWHSAVPFTPWYETRYTDSTATFR